VVLDIDTHGHERLGKLARAEIVGFQHAEDVGGGDVEELDTGAEEEDAELDRGGSAGGGHCGWAEG